MEFEKNINNYNNCTNKVIDKYNNYQEKFNYYKGIKDYENAINYGKKLQNISNSNEIKNEIGLLYLSISNLYLSKNDFNNTLKYIDEGIKNADKTIKGELEYIKGEVLLSTKKYDDALINFKKAINNSTDYKTIEKANNKINEINIYNKKQNNIKQDKKREEYELLEKSIDKIFNKIKIKNSKLSKEKKEVIYKTMVEKLEKRKNKFKEEKTIYIFDYFISLAKNELNYECDEVSKLLGLCGVE